MQPVFAGGCSWIYRHVGGRAGMCCCEKSATLTLVRRHIPDYSCMGNRVPVDHLENECSKLSKNCETLAEMPGVSNSVKNLC